jgi:sulfide:quinone oxidoreductase
LGAGFGGLELASILSDQLGDYLDLTLIDKNDFFYFGYSKLDIMFGRRPAGSVKYDYNRIQKIGVKFRQEKILSIDPENKHVKTDHGGYDSDVLVIALGADYNIAATPGLAESGYEFYSFEGAERVRDFLPSFRKGHALIAVTGFPFKCPPAPSEAALLLDAYLRSQGIRQHCRISLVLPFELPIPPSFGASKALLKSFQEKGINYIPEIMVGSIDPARKTAELDDGREIPFDVFLGIPEHKVPGVVEESGLVFDEWVPVDRSSLKTRFSNVYAIGDVCSVGTPKSGQFALAAATAAAESIISEFYEREPRFTHSGTASCHIEFGSGKVARADVDFFSKQVASGVFYEPSVKLAEEKKMIESSLNSRWFGNHQ